MRTFHIFVLTFVLFFSAQMQSEIQAQNMSPSEVQGIAEWSNELQTAMLELLEAVVVLEEIDTVLVSFEAGEASIKNVNSKLSKYRVLIDTALVDYRLRLEAMPDPPVADPIFFSGLKTSQILLLEQADDLDEFFDEVFQTARSILKGNDGAAANRMHNVYKRGALLVEGDIRILGAQLFMIPGKHPQGDLFEAMVATSTIDMSLFMYEGQRLYVEGGPDQSLLDDVRVQMIAVETKMAEGHRHTNALVTQLRAQQLTVSSEYKVLIQRLLPLMGTYEDHWVTFGQSRSAYTRLLEAYDNESDSDAINAVFWSVMDETGELDILHQEFLLQRTVGMMAQ